MPSQHLRAMVHGRFSWHVSSFFGQRQHLLRASSLPWTRPRSASFKMRGVDACLRARMSARVHACAPIPTRTAQPNTAQPNPPPIQPSPNTTSPNTPRHDPTQGNPARPHPTQFRPTQPYPLRALEEAAIRASVTFPRRAEFPPPRLLVGRQTRGCVVKISG